MTYDPWRPSHRCQKALLLLMDEPAFLDEITKTDENSRDGEIDKDLG